MARARIATVVAEGPAQPLLDRADGTAGQRDRRHDAAQVATDEGDVGDGYVGAGSDGHAEVGLGQGGRVVDAVADHGDDPAAGLQSRDPFGLLRGQDLSDDLLDADRGGYRFGGGRGVAGEHPHLEPERLQLRDGFRGSGLDRVGDRDEPHSLPADPHVHRCLAGRGRGRARHRERADVDTAGGHEGAVADPHLAAAHGRLHALSGNGLESPQLGRGQTAVGGGGHDGLRERVLAAGLRGGGQGEDLLLDPAGRGDDRGDRRAPSGDGAGFVQDDRGQPLRLFQGVTIADEDAKFGGLAGADHHRGRGGQA